MRHCGDAKLVDDVLATTIPMYGRMIHGKRSSGTLFEESQTYDAYDRVSTLFWLATC
jgi:kynurenine 3-monooxygenase